MNPTKYQNSLGIELRLQNSIPIKMVRKQILACIFWSGALCTPTLAANRITKFHETYPTCQIWTDWAKVCKGRPHGGEFACVSSRSRRLKNSEPFCVVENATPLLISTMAFTNAKQQASVLRFCDRKVVVHGWNGKSDLRGFACARYRRNRPFNDSSDELSADHWCKKWEKTSNHMSVQQCVKWSLPSWCARAAIYGDLPEQPNEPGSIDTRAPYVRDTTPIVTSYCSSIRS